MLRILVVNALLFSVFAVPVWSSGEKVTYHDDHLRPHTIFNPDYSLPPRAKHGDVAQRYIRAYWQRFQLEPDAANMELFRVQHSLLGTHYHFRQMVNGLPLEFHSMVVSVEKEAGRIYKVFNNTMPIMGETRPLPKVSLDPMDALHLAWDHLKVHGKFFKKPETAMVYREEKGAISLIIRVNMLVDAPFGEWSLAVDALDGRILSVRDTLSYRRSEPAVDFHVYKGPLSDLDRELADVALLEDSRRQVQNKTTLKRAQGSATVFDPDPRTTLANEGLDDFSPASAFEGSYLNRTLLDISLNDATGEFTLDGPWVRVEALNVTQSQPNTQPSTTNDGNWNFQRGVNAFNDAMVYFHLDQNQRYIQSLGFTGVSGIQEGPMRVDTDGIGGADQSFFTNPSFLVFGHGCVPDPEDVDVILHEYGHGLQYSIFNRAFVLNDEPAIGEGFGDYWATSYSLQTPNGAMFHPEWVFSWDGHSFCWNGRVVDAFNALYQNGRSYNIAHEQIGSFSVDELWSTPLFQALFELYKQGYPIRQADQIVLESHFGLGGGVTMPLLAQSTVDAAARLYPNGPHADIFRASFAAHNILPAATTYRYLAAHVPPSGSAIDWQSEIQIHNPNGAAATITATAFEGDATTIGLADFTARPVANLNLAGHGTTTFQPDGERQRWVLFESDQPLTGTSFFTRNRSDALGRERAGIPLFSEQEVADTLIIPHVPANREKFWSGAVLLNPNQVAVDLTIELFGINGSDLSQLLLPGTPTRLEPRQKWVTFLAEGPGGEQGVFDDSGSAEKVSYIRVSGSGEIAGFQLYGYKADQAVAEDATAGIMALPDQTRSVWPVRVSVTGAEWSGLSILNPTDQAIAMDVVVYGKDRQILAQVNGINLPARQKMLGLNLAGGRFRFPSVGDPLIDLPNGDNVQSFQIKTTAPLRVFELGGDLDNRQIDGSAVYGLTTDVVFTNASGVLEIFKAELGGTVTVTTRRTGGRVDQVSHVLAVGESLSLLLDDDDIESVRVQGEMFSAALIDQDVAERSLTVVNGKQALPFPSN